MKYGFVILLMLLLSCKTGFVSNNTNLRNEILSYNLIGIDTLVDIGCGSAEHDALISFYNPGLYFILEDIDNKFPVEVDSYFNGNSTLVNHIRKLHRNVVGTTDSIPLESGKFNFVLCRKSFHEFSEKAKMISQINRILVDNGTLVMVEVAPIHLNETDPYCKKLLLDKQSIVNFVEKQNFRLVRSSVLEAGKKRIFNILTFKKT